MFLGRQLKWSKNNIPNRGYDIHTNDTWVLLCIDGVVARDTGNAAVGEWGILDGLLLLLDKGYERAIILIDNLEVIQALSDLGLENPCITVLKRTQCMMRAEGQWKIRYMSKEHNLATDRLAKLSLVWKSSLQVFEETPKEILELL
ncbi:hypothetical protein Golax_025608 [Gossypium laxum]|uniref:RNase H type-1 domain-containing protein n=1 Tax=Gossypium laxum TaxID=34288 RepID=A0A7J9B3F9_9ROSI|nr:hypothetical protein [Gossypium laxum]